MKEKRLLGIILCGRKNCTNYEKQRTFGVLWCLYQQQHMRQKYGSKNMRPTFTDAMSYSTQKTMQSTSTQNNLLGESMAIKRTEVFILQTIQVSQYE